MQQQLVECVPNISEGRDPSIIKAIASRCLRPDVWLLHVDSEPSTNRSVLTLVGTPTALTESVVELCRAASELIDMSTHKGAHPRLGAVDVIPLVPLQNISMGECIQLSHVIGERLAEELGISIYLYEHSARLSERASLARIRVGEYEGLANKLQEPAWTPDFGPLKFQPRWGATVLGARDFLIAYNVTLASGDIDVARAVAFALRESGPPRQDPALLQGLPALHFTRLRCIGWFLDSLGRTQVSCNLLDYRTTGLAAVYGAARQCAKMLGTEVTGSEIVGLVPEEALLHAGWAVATRDCSNDEALRHAVDALGLSELGEFDSEQRVLERRLAAVRSS